MEYNLMVNQEKKCITAVVSDRNIRVQTENSIIDAEFTPLSDHQILLSIDGKMFNTFIYPNGNKKTVVIKGQSYEIEDADLMEEALPGKKSFVNTATTVASPMPAVVIGILTKIGDRVKKGQGLVIVSAMKMETTLFAPFDGTISAINAKIGDKVMPSHILVDIEKDKERP